MMSAVAANKDNISQKSSGTAVFGSQKHEEIATRLNQILDAQVALFLTDDKNKHLASAFDLYFNTADILNNENAEEILRGQFEKIGVEGDLMYAHLRHIQSHLTQIAELWAYKNRPDTAEVNPYNIETVVELSAKAGRSYRETMALLENSKIWKTITPHPTETLSEEGVALFQEAIAAGELPVRQREEALRDVLYKMLRTNMSPLGKNNTFKETDQATKQAIIYRQGQREFSARLQNAIEKNYGGRYDTSDLRQRMPKIVLHLWQGGADTDGKLNADRWARLYGMTSITREAAKDHLRDLSAAKKSIRNKEKLKSKFNAANGQFEILEAALTGLDERFKNIEDQFVAVDKNGVKTLKERADYQSIKKQFEDLTKSLEICGQKYTNSGEFCEEITKRFGTLANSIENPKAKHILESSQDLLNDYGLAIAKLEPRHNGKVYAHMMDKLFTDTTFFNAAQKICEIPLGEYGAFSKIPGKQQLSILTKIEEKMPSNQIVAALDRANLVPKEQPSDLEIQGHEFLELFSLTAIDPDKFGKLALISEAHTHVSSAHQNFIMNSFGLTNFIHTPLHEDYESAKKAPESVGEFYNSFGLSGLLKRMHSKVKGPATECTTQGIFIFCSDAIKDYGRLVTRLQAEGIRGSIVTAIKADVALLVKIGNGLALERCGGDPMMFGRYIAEAVRDHAEERYKAGHPLDPKNNARDQDILSMVSFLSHTEQGRAMRIYSATPKHVAHEMANQIGEMLGRQLEILGKVKKGYFIPLSEKINKNTHNIVDSLSHKIMGFFKNFRHATTGIEDAGSVTNSWAAKILGFVEKLLPFSNHSARAASKDTGGIAKGLVEQRAIGNQRGMILLDTHHDGWFGCGEFMRKIHENFKEKNISARDVEDFAIDDAWWRRQFFSRGFAAAIRADLTRGFKKMGAGDKWTFDRCMEVGAQCKIEEIDGKPVFSYNPPKKFDSEGVVPQEIVPLEEAYHAKLVYDLACFSALTEAAQALREYGDLAETPFSRPLEELLQNVRPADNSVNVIFGQQLRERMSWLAEIEKQEERALADKVLVEYTAAHQGQFKESGFRAIMSNVFASTFPCMRFLLGLTEYGYRQAPDPENALAATPFQVMVERNIPKIPANQNSSAVSLFEPA